MYQSNDLKRFNLETQAREGVEEPTLNALEYLQSIYRNPAEATSVRIRAAVEALPFEAPKLSAVAVASMSGADFAKRPDRAIERSGKAKLPAPTLLSAGAPSNHDLQKSNS